MFVNSNPENGTPRHLKDPSLWYQIRPYFTSEPFPLCFCFWAAESFFQSWSSRWVDSARAAEEFPETVFIFPSPLWLVEERMIPSSSRTSVTQQTRGAEESLFFSLIHPLTRSLAPLVSPSHLCSSSLVRPLIDRWWTEVGGTSEIRNRQAHLIFCLQDPWPANKKTAEAEKQKINGCLKGAGADLLHKAAERWLLYWPTSDCVLTNSVLFYVGRNIISASLWSYLLY